MQTVPVFPEKTTAFSTVGQTSVFSCGFTASLFTRVQGAWLSQAFMPAAPEVLEGYESLPDLSPKIPRLQAEMA